MREPGRMVPVHLLDSLALLPLVRGRALAGRRHRRRPARRCRWPSPGPDLAVTLIEPAGKKAPCSCAHGARTARARQCPGRCSARVEDVHPGGRFDTVVTRAFGTLGEFVAAAGLCVAAGRPPAGHEGPRPGRARSPALPAGLARGDPAAGRCPASRRTRHAVRHRARTSED
ncbi:MAG: hypothetical protein U5K43_04815 [Halofilum sp. (in: g-proteobacteria)]|nr:hypothetical protein [Halofilum sp. (in: g-proteobacteria)]